MVRDARRLRLLWLTLACTTLAACGGGGGGGGGTTPTPSPPPPASESAYLLAEFVAADSNNQFVRVWDPANPAVAVQNVRLVQSNGIAWTSSHLVFSDATTWDAGSRSVTTLGHAKVFYDNDGKLYSIDLRGGQSHAPVQLSSAVDVFMPTRAVAMDAAGDDAWVDAQGGSHHWAIRTSMSATAAPVSVQGILAPLRDASTGVPQFLFASLGSQSGTHTVATTYEVVDATFTPVAVPAVAGMVAADGWIGVDPGQAGLAYLDIGGQLRALRWSAGTVGVDAAGLHDFTGSVFVSAVADAQSVYVNDGATLLALSNGSVRTVGTFGTLPTSLLDAGGYVVALEGIGLASAQVQYQLETLAKADGTLTLVEPPSSSLQLLAAGDAGLVLAGTPEQGQAFVLASGDNRTRTTLGAQFVGVVRAASGRADQPAAPVGLLSCVAGASGFCAPGALTQYTLAGAAGTAGTLAASAAIVRGDAVAGVPVSLSGQTLLSTVGGFAADETETRDAWQFTPGSVSSLARVTSNLP